MLLLLLGVLKIVSNLGDDRDETLPREVPFRLLAATDMLNDSSMFAICSIIKWV